MIIVMAASGTEETVCSPRHVWCFSEADARRAAAALAAQFPEDDMDIFSVDFPELGAAQKSAAWQKSAQGCVELTLALYLKSLQPVALELCEFEPKFEPEFEPGLEPAAAAPLRRRAA